MLVYLKANTMLKGDNMKQELVNIKIPQPAQRALKGAGIETIEHLTKYTEEELLSLHGFGPRALGILKIKLEEYGLSFKEKRSEI